MSFDCNIICLNTFQEFKAESINISQVNKNPFGGMPSMDTHVIIKCNEDFYDFAGNTNGKYIDLLVLKDDNFHLFLGNSHVTSYKKKRKGYEVNLNTYTFNQDNLERLSVSYENVKKYMRSKKINDLLDDKEDN